MTLPQESVGPADNLAQHSIAGGRTGAQTSDDITFDKVDSESDLELSCEHDGYCDYSDAPRTGGSPEHESPKSSSSDDDVPVTTAPPDFWGLRPNNTLTRHHVLPRKALYSLPCRFTQDLPHIHGVAHDLPTRRTIKRRKVGSYGSLGGQPQRPDRLQLGRLHHVLSKHQ